MKKNLTRRQADALRIITSFIAENGYPPSVRDIQAGLDVSSLSTTQRLLRQLQDLGVIEWTPGRSRTIRVKS